MLRRHSIEKQTALGWGSKSTQFHGSLGKSAATKPTTQERVGTSSDDDNVPRISWRGDGAFFSVSSVETVQDVSRRVVRVFSVIPELSLSSTTEPTAGLEHTLSWNPSGSLIASTQRFSSHPENGLGMGREGRHDVIFFERNGLRRGGFELTKSESNSSSLVPSHRVVQLAWSCDSNLLAVWIRVAQVEDIGALHVILHALDAYS